MNLRLIIVQAVVLAAAALLYFATKPAAVTEGEAAEADALLLADFHVDKVRKISIRSGKEKADLVRRSVKEGEREKDRWFVESAWNCDADEKNVDALLDEVRKLKKGLAAGSNAELYSKFGLDEESRHVAQFLDADGKAVAELHLGKQNFAMPDFSSFGGQEKDNSTTYVRLADSAEVRKVPGSHSVTALRSHWVDLKVTELEFKELTRLEIETEKGVTVLVRRKKEPAPDEGGKDKEKDKKKEDEFEWRIEKAVPGREMQFLKTSESDVDSFIRSLASIRATDVAEPMDVQEVTRNEGGRPVTEEEVPLEQKKKYGFDKPVLAIRAFMDDKSETLVHFGKAASPKAPGKDKDSGGAADDKYYAYLPEMRSSFQIAITKALGMETGTETKRFLRVFVLDEWRFGNVNKGERDFREKAKESKDALVKGFFEDEVDQVAIESASGKMNIARKVSDFVFARYGREIWAAASHHGYPVDTRKVEELLRKIKDLKMGEVIEGNEKNDAACGLGKGEGVRVALVDKTQKAIADFTVGKAEKVKDKEVTYFRLAGDKDIREVPGTHAFGVAAQDWIEYTITNCELADVDAVIVRVVREDGTEIENIFVRNRTGGWARQTISDSGQAKFLKVDEAKVDAIANLVTHLSGVDLAPPMAVSSKSSSIPESQLLPYGFEKDFMRAGFQKSDGSQLMVRFGTKDGKHYAFMYSGERQMGMAALPEIKFRVFEVRDTVVKAFDKDADFFSADKKEEKKEGAGEKKEEGGKEPGGDKGKEGGDAPGGEGGGQGGGKSEGGSQPGDGEKKEGEGGEAPKEGGGK